MTPEELLKPRYKVIAPWPGTHWKVGDIFEYGDHNCFKTESQPSIPMHVSVLDEHPHLFKKLEWREERKPEEMPEYVKITGMGCSIIEDTIVKVEGSGKFEDASFDNYGESYVLLRDKHFDVRGLTRMNCKNVIPATAAEYEAYLQTLTHNNK
jgi:hypothetical protein